MISVRELSERLSTFDIIAAVNRAVTEHEADIEAIVREQMYSGMNGDDEPIGLYKSLAYADEKNNQNPIPGFGVVDLYLTGAFYSGIEAEPNGTGVTIFSRDSKNNKLAEKYGDEIFKLGTEAKQKIMAIIAPTVREYLRQHIGIL